MTEEKKTVVTEINPAEVAVSTPVFGRADLDKIPSPKPIKKYIESLKAFVYFRQINGKDLEDYEHLITKLVDQGDGNMIIEQRQDSLRAKWIVICLCNEKGVQEYKPEEFALLDRLEAGVIKEMYDAAQDANSVAKEALERARKNLSTEKEVD